MTRGAKIGRYLVTETLGEGVFGKVKLAVNEQNGVEYAMKILNKSDIRANELGSNVRTEIAIMKALNHVNVNGLCEVMSSNTKLYIVMDLVRGSELYSIVKEKGMLEEKIARSYFTQLVDGVGYCHSRGVCHRDLKPENLLVNQQGVLKITDFGVSAMIGAPSVEAQLLYTACGTPQYCAPEILSRSEEGYSGFKVDAWSCGIILYVLLVGMPPFDDDNMSGLYKAIKSCNVDYPLWVSDDAKDLLQHILVPDPDKRFSIDDIKQHYWFKGISRQQAISMSSVSTASSKSNSSSDHSIGEVGKVPEFPREPKILQEEHQVLSRSKASVNLDDTDIPVTPRTPPKMPRPKRRSRASSKSARPIIKNLSTEFPDGDLYDMMRAILPKRQRQRLEDTVDKLDMAGIDCVQDMNFLASNFKRPEGVIKWLTEKTRLSDICCMRIGKFLFVENHKV
eukprot:Plantae.Rhodophyta-Hildenbrandia_rubra.ctg34710.p1 GENE.Plantae.Rhodophyta-Hildenbrandia_rubra.ctg34710~~Plantae.Rhodophyta-Hildenbrandia_rubra.ctg34710.p1  ORF type:complete len:451 (-),score=77.86 Plantae.Rhodophyta-Hildenbrandia_rubra.ctg34710:1698-3050(-)